jgi:hypothetical protein
MDQTFGRGLFRSLRKQASDDLQELIRKNRRLKRARYSFPLRVFRSWVSDRRLRTIVLAYILIDTFLLAVEWAATKYLPCLVPSWTSTDLHGLIKDIASYFLATQIAILSIISVAIGVVTLITQRTEGVSARTEIRLYYFESFAYEVVTSGIALTLVLAGQLFWPAQYALHLWGAGGNSLLFKVILTGVHATWLGLNLLMFFQFMTTTLRFVEPGARERLREHFSANAIIPMDVLNRVLGALYLQTPNNLLGEEDNDRGPRVTFGFGPTFPERANRVIRSDFEAPSKLHDVWLLPFGWAVWSWRRRVRKKVQTRPADAFSQARWDDRLAVSLSFDDELDGTREWVRHEGTVAPNWLERQLMRISFRFRRIDDTQRDLPTPDDFMEELADQLIGQINKTAVTGFKAALDELIRFHRFVLEAQQTTDDDGNRLNYAQVGGFFQRPDQGWVREYRRIFQAAANKIGDDTGYMHRLNHVPLRLLPRSASTTSIEVLTAILELGIHEVLALENWFTRRTTIDVAEGAEAEPRLSLAGSDSRAYGQVLINFVGAWESVLQMAGSIFGWREQPDADAASFWQVRANAWQFLQTHLHACGYFVAAAVWNEDEAASDRYRDLLLRWLEPIYAEVEATYDIRFQWLLTPEWFTSSWAEVEPFAVELRRFPFPRRLSPKTVASVLLRGALSDVVVVTAAIALAWHARRQQLSDIGGRTAALLINRQVLTGEGSRLTNPGEPRVTPFQSVWALILRVFLELRPGGMRYGAVIDGLIQRLNQMSARYIVPGRVYSGWGSDGVDALQLEFLAMLAATLPDAGDEGVLEMVVWVASNEGLFAAGDQSIQNAIYSLQRFAGGLGETLETAAFERAVRALSPDANPDDRRSRLRALILALADALAEERLERLRAEPLDAAKVEALLARSASLLRTYGPTIFPFTGYRVEFEDAPARREAFRVSGLQKGVFVTPPRSPITVEQDADAISGRLREYLAALIRRSFYRRPRGRIVPLAGSRYPRNLWRAVMRRAAQVGPHPVLLVDGDIAERVTIWTMSVAAANASEFPVSYRENVPGGIGGAYVATVGGIDVFQTNDVTAGTSILCSGNALVRVAYSILPESGDILTVTVTPDQEDDTCLLALGFAQSIEWSEAPIFEFRLR